MTYNISQGRFDAPTPIPSSVPMPYLISPLLSASIVSPSIGIETPPIIDCQNPLEDEVCNLSVNCVSNPTMNNLKALFKSIDIYAKTLRYSQKAQTTVIASINHVFSLRPISRRVLSKSLEGFPDEFNTFLYKCLSTLPETIKSKFALCDLNKTHNESIQSVQLIANQIISNINVSADVHVPQNLVVKPEQAYDLTESPKPVGTIEPLQIQIKNKKKRKSKNEEDQDFEPGNILEEFSNHKIPKKKPKSKRKLKTLKVNSKNAQLEDSQNPTIENIQNIQISNQPSNFNQSTIQNQTINPNQTVQNQFTNLNQTTIPNQIFTNSASSSNQALDLNHQVTSTDNTTTIQTFPNQASTSNQTLHLNQQVTSTDNNTPILISKPQQILEKAWHLNPKQPTSVSLTFPLLNELYHKLSNLQKASLDRVYNEFQNDILKAFNTIEITSFFYQFFQNEFPFSYVDIHYLLIKRKEKHHKFLKIMLNPFVNLFSKLQKGELADVHSNLFSAIWFNAIISSSLIFPKYDDFFIDEFCSVMNLEFDIGNVADYLLVGLWYSTEYFIKNKFIVGFQLNNEGKIPSREEKRKINFEFIKSRKVEEMF